MTEEERRISDLRAQSVMDRYKTTFRPKKSRRVEDLQEVAGLSFVFSQFDSYRSTCNATDLLLYITQMQYRLSI